MVEAVAPDSVATTAGGPFSPPKLEELFLFLESLRQQGYRIDARHMAAAERLLTDAVAAGIERDAGRLKFWLAPIVAKSPKEQEDFYRQFDRWRGSIPVSAPALPPRRAGPATEAVRRDLRWMVIVGTIALMIGLGAATYWYFWPPTVEPPLADGKYVESEKTQNSPPERFTVTATMKTLPPLFLGVEVAVAAAPLLAFAAWLLLRWQRRAVWLRHGTSHLESELATVPIPMRLYEALFSDRPFRDSAHDLRKHRAHPTRELDIRRTVDRTAAEAGMFGPVYRDRRQSPEYVFLIEQSGANDHLSRLFDVAVERLRSEGVFIQRYYFHTDPQQVQTDDDERTPMALADLLARIQDHRLFVVATADGFFHPLTGEVEAWVQQLQPWQSRTMLNTRPLDQWTMAEVRLLEEGFSLATAELSGFVAAGEKAALGTDEAELLEGVIVMPLTTRQPLRPIAEVTATAAIEESRLRSVDTGAPLTRPLTRRLDGVALSLIAVASFVFYAMLHRYQHATDTYTCYQPGNSDVTFPVYIQGNGGNFEVWVNGINCGTTGTDGIWFKGGAGTKLTYECRPIPAGPSTTHEFVVGATNIYSCP